MHIDLFDGHLNSALFFYEKEASKLYFANHVLNMQLSNVNR